ncbi:MAG TPA: hypothetical protein VFW71_03450 [Actinomycetota bacterium]|nr:hypothetical protein [Actinomycetota bacterium]
MSEIRSIQSRRLVPSGEVPCRVGVWGSFGSGQFGDALIPQILRRELRARLPAVDIRVAAPSAEPLSGRDHGDTVTALGPWSEQRSRELAAEFDCVIVAGADLFADPDAGRFFVEGPVPGPGGAPCPVVWLAVGLPAVLTAEQRARLAAVAGSRHRATATDPAASLHLLEAGVTEVGVVADCCLLASRLWVPETLAKRLDYLRLMGWYPRDGAPLVVECGVVPAGGLPALAAGIAAFLGDHPGMGAVLAETGLPGGDAAFVRSLAAALIEAGVPEGGWHHLPACASLEDLGAALAACGAFAGGALRSAVVARSFGRPAVLINDGDGSESDRPPGDGGPGLALGLALRRAVAGPVWAGHLATELDRLDEALDGAAFIAVSAARHRQAPAISDEDRLQALEEQLATLEVAHDARSRRLATERMVFANQLHKAEQEIAALKAEAARLREEVSSALAKLAQAERSLHAEAGGRAATEAELLALRATRTFRYTAELRSVYGRLRRIAESPEHPITR